MSKRDFFHNTVCEILSNDGWHITDDPLYIEWGGATIKIDIGAERLIAAERGDKKWHDLWHVVEGSGDQGFHEWLKTS